MLIKAKHTIYRKSTSERKEDVFILGFIGGYIPTSYSPIGVVYTVEGKSIWIDNSNNFEIDLEKTNQEQG